MKSVENSGILEILQFVPQMFSFLTVLTENPNIIITLD